MRRAVRDSRRWPAFGLRALVLSGALALAGCDEGPSGQAGAAAPPIWARFYEIGTNKPIFSSRCEVPECDSDPFYMRRYSLAEIDNERRVGYAWYGDWPIRALAAYPAWVVKWQP